MFWKASLKKMAFRGGLLVGDQSMVWESAKDNRLVGDVRIQDEGVGSENYFVSDFTVTKYAAARIQQSAATEGWKRRSRITNSAVLADQQIVIK